MSDSSESSLLLSPANRPANQVRRHSGETGLIWNHTPLHIPTLRRMNAGSASLMIRTHFNSFMSSSWSSSLTLHLCPRSKFPPRIKHYRIPTWNVHQNHHPITRVGPNPILPTAPQKSDHELHPRKEAKGVCPGSLRTQTNSTTAREFLHSQHMAERSSATFVFSFAQTCLVSTDQETKNCVMYHSQSVEYTKASLVALESEYLRPTVRCNQ